MPHDDDTLDGCAALLDSTDVLDDRDVATLVLTAGVENRDDADAIALRLDEYRELFVGGDADVGHRTR